MSSPGDPVPLTTRQELRHLIRLAWPVALSQLGMMAMGLVDMLVAGQLGPNAVAAVGLGHAWSFASLIFGMGVAMGIDPAVTQAFGAGDRNRAGLAAARGGILMLALSLPIIAFHLVAEPGLIALGQPPEIIATAARYSQIQAIGVIPFLLFTVLKQFLQAQEQMRTAMWVVGIGNLANLVLDLLCVWALDLGVPGLALSSAGVRWVMFFSLLALGWRWILRARPTGRVLDWTAVSGLATIAIPVGFQIAMEVWAFNATTFLAGTLGAAATAAHVIALSVTSLAFMVPLGVAAAVTTRVGNLVGAGLPWRRSAGVGVFLGSTSMLLSGTVFLAIPGVVAWMFAAPPAVAALVVIVLPIGAAYGLSDSIQVVLFGVLRGLGDTRIPALFPLIAYWCIGLPGAAWAAHAGFGLQGIWIGLSVALTVVAALLAVRVIRS